MTEREMNRMTKRQMVEYSLRKLAEFAALPPEEQMRRMVAAGTINEKGEVLMGGVAQNEDDQAKDEEPRQSNPE